jgi:type II secretory pathway pseudopilin PulG
MQAGFTYLMLLWWVAISGVMLMALAQRWSTESQREREKEMVFRGEQIRRAIEAYASVPVREGMSPYPSNLADLLQDERPGPDAHGQRHHLRRLWPDPVTGGAWGLLREGEGIKGVYSTSPKEPLAAPAGVQRFEDWRFEAQAPPPAMPPSAPDSAM